MLTKLILLVTALAACIGCSAAADSRVVKWYGNMTFNANYRLRRAGLGSEGSVDDVFTMLTKISPDQARCQYPKHELDTEFALDYLVHMGKVLKGTEQVDCLDDYANAIVRFYDYIKLPTVHSYIREPLKNYIAEAYKKVTQFCTETFSQDNWSAFENVRLVKKPEFADLTEKELKDVLDDPSKLDDKVYQKLTDVCKSRSEQQPNEVFEAIQFMARRAGVLFKNMGHSIPLDKFDHRMKTLYTLSQIWADLDEDVEAIQRMTFKLFAEEHGHEGIPSQYPGGQRGCVMNTVGMEKRALGLVHLDANVKSGILREEYKQTVERCIRENGGAPF